MQFHDNHNSVRKTVLSNVVFFT